MSGLEALAVIGCIAAVCSAYVDGSELVHNLRVRRARKKALQEAPREDVQAESLEMSLSRGNTRVRSRYDQDFMRIGERYARGDDLARDQLKDIIIHLQSAVIMNLKYAWREDTTVDFQSLEDTSEESQMRATLCLIDLNKRMLVAAPITELPLFSTQRESISVLHRNSPTSMGLNSMLKEYPVATESIPVSKGSDVSKPYTIQVPWEQPGSLQHIKSISQQNPELDSKKNKQRSFSFTSWGRNKSSTTLPSVSQLRTELAKREPSPNVASRSSTVRSSATTDLSRSSTVRSSVTTESSQPDSIDYNPWIEETSKVPKIPPSGITTSRPKPTTSISAPPAISPPHSHRTSFASVTSSIPPTRLKTIPTNETISASTTSSLLPSDSNAYRGLCKSAWRLQTSQQNKAVQAKTMPASAYSLMKRYWGCTECAFRGTLIKDPTTKKDIFDSRLYQSRDGRVKFRWLFLFRSHVKIKEREPDRYSCVFCCAEPPVGGGSGWGDGLPIAVGPLEVFADVEGLLAHIGREHTGEGKWPEGRVLWHMNCAIEGGGGVGEGWDVLLCESMEDATLPKGGRTLLAVAQKCARNFDASISKQPPGSIQRIELSNQLDRLKIWAGDVGVFATGRASADYRLRQDPNIMTAITITINRINRQLETLISRPHTLEEKLSTDELSDNSSDSISESSSDANNETTPSSAWSHQPTRLEAILYAVTDLYRLSAVIKKTEQQSDASRIDR